MSKRLAALAVLSIVAFPLPMRAASPDRKTAANPDIVEIRHYPLTMDKVERLAAAYDGIFKLMKSNPKLRNESKDAPTIDAKAREFDKDYPEATAIIHAKGFSTREYIVASMALFNDVMIVGMKKQGMLKSYPPDMVTPENAAFVEKNYDKVSALAKKMTPPNEETSDDAD